MQTPTITDLLSTRLGADWLEEPLAFYVGSGGSLDNFSGCSIAGGIYLNGKLILDMSTAANPTYAAITQPNIINIAVPAAAMNLLGAGVFRVSLSLITAGGQLQDLINFGLEVVSP